MNEKTSVPLLLAKGSAIALGVTALCYAVWTSHSNAAILREAENARRAAAIVEGMQDVSDSVETSSLSDDPVEPLIIEEDFESGAETFLGSSKWGMVDMRPVVVEEPHVESDQLTVEHSPSGLPYVVAEDGVCYLVYHKPNEEDRTFMYTSKSGMPMLRPAREVEWVKITEDGEGEAPYVMGERTALGSDEKEYTLMPLPADYLLE